MAAGHALTLPSMVVGRRPKRREGSLNKVTGLLLDCHADGWVKGGETRTSGEDL